MGSVPALWTVADFIELAQLKMRLAHRRTQTHTSASQCWIASVARSSVAAGGP